MFNKSDNTLKFKGKNEITFPTKKCIFWRETNLSYLGYNNSAIIYKQTFYFRNT